MASLAIFKFVFAIVLLTCVSNYLYLFTFCVISIGFTTYSSYSRIGRGKIVSRHTVSYLLLNFWDIACWMEFNASLCWMKQQLSCVQSDAGTAPQRPQYYIEWNNGVINFLITRDIFISLWTFFKFYCHSYISSYYFLFYSYISSSHFLPLSACVDTYIL